MATAHHTKSAPEALSANSFCFINSSTPTVPQGRDVRTTIRRQAMTRAAAARRQRGDYGKNNLSQLPPYAESGNEITEKHAESSKANQDEAVHQTAVESSNSSNETSGTLVKTNISQGHKAYIPDRLKISSSLPSTNYDLLRIQHGFDILDLSALTTFHTARATAQAIAKAPSRLVDVLRTRQWSYMSFIPGRYGLIECLDDAVRCVTARVQRRLLFADDATSPSVMTLYTKALASLQAALNHPDCYLKPDVLCATELLAMFEMFNAEGDQAWVRHVSGASQLIRVRGPGRYSTEFEKALFLAQAGPIITEALLKGHACFLEEDAWQEVFRSTIHETSQFSDRSKIVISLFMDVCHVPRLFNDVQTAVCSSESTPLSKLDQLMNRAWMLRRKLLSWRAEYHQLLIQAQSTSPQILNSDKRYEILGVCLTMLVVVNRLIVALNPSMTSDLEAETQTLANSILYVEQEACAANPRAGLFMAFKAIVANATLATKEAWQVFGNTHCAEFAGERPVIAKEVFEHWCDLKGRKMTARGLTRGWRPEIQI